MIFMYTKYKSFTFSSSPYRLIGPFFFASIMSIICVRSGINFLEGYQMVKASGSNKGSELKNFELSQGHHRDLKYTFNNNHTSLLTHNAGHSLLAEPVPHKQEIRLNIDSILKKVELIPLLINGEKDNRINIVIMNRWTSREKAPYNSPQMKTVFLNDIKESLLAALTPGDKRAQTVFANYNKFFNVYALWWPDIPEWDKGVDISIADSLRNRLFLPWKDEHTGWVTLLAMPNVRSGGGGAARNLEERIGDAVIAGNGIGKMLHEISHTCMSLGDEYTGAQTGTSQVPTYNATIEYRRDKIKWRKWIDNNTPLPTPYTAEYLDKAGAFEGNGYHLTNYFRASAQGCIMGAGIFDNTEKMCAVCEQRVSMRVNRLVNPVNSYFPSENIITINGETDCRFSIDHIRPEPNTQMVRWILNGKTIASGTDSINIKLGAISDYELICSLTDETPFIRPDPPYAEYPRREIRWRIRNVKPLSKAPDLKLTIQAVNKGEKISGRYELYAVVSGGKPPYNYEWSNGDKTDRLSDAVPGIYNLMVTDKEFRQVKRNYSLYSADSSIQSFEEKSKGIKSVSTVLKVKESITAASKENENGKIELEIAGGVPPYRIEWSDKKYEYKNEMIYEAENASINVPGYSIRNYFAASNNAYVSFNSNEGSITWKIDVARSGVYPVDIVYGSTRSDTSQVTVSVDGSKKSPVSIYATRPLFTGWEQASFNVYLKKGINWVTLSSAGESGPNIDYLKVPASFTELVIADKERNNLKPGNYSVLIKDSKNNAIVKSFFVNEADPFIITPPELIISGNQFLIIKNPLPGVNYQWYQNDAPSFYPEKFEKPLAVGNEFIPPGPGNYFISAKNIQTNAESSNRIGISINKQFTDAGVKEIDPSLLIQKGLLLWLDASDPDAKGKPDQSPPKRDPFAWKDKINPENGTILIKYQPNQLNGKGISAFDNVWVQSFRKAISGFQTIIMVYKESDMTMPGKSPFTGLSRYIGKSSDSRKRLFDPETINEKTKKGATYLNGKRVDPFDTPNPMNYCILTVELGSIAADSVMKTEGYWEGSLAELLLFNRILSENERKGIEEYMRKKWFSSFDLDFKE